MANKCTKCGKIHPDEADYLLTKGCNACGGRFFFFVRDEMLNEVEKEVAQITKKEMKEIERDIRSIVPARRLKKKGEKEETVVLDIEAIRVIKPGKYQIDVDTLFNQRPIVVRVGDGRYELDISSISAKAKEAAKK